MLMLLRFFKHIVDSLPRPLDCNGVESLFGGGNLLRDDLYNALSQIQLPRRMLNI